MTKPDHPKVEELPDRIVRSPAELSAVRLTEIMQREGSMTGGRVVSVNEVVGRHGPSMFGQMYHLSVEYSADCPDDIPHMLLLKVSRDDLDSGRLAWGEHEGRVLCRHTGSCNRSSGSALLQRRLFPGEWALTCTP